MRTGQHAMTVTLGSNHCSAYPQYETGTTYLNQSYLSSLSHTFSPSLLHSVKASYTRYNPKNSYDPLLKSCR
jgi:hypothetical protein